MQVAVLSPHRDDAAFSCGLTLHSLLEAGSSLTIVNICTISRYAPHFTERECEEIEQVSALRRDEDEDFVETLRHTAGAKSGQIRLVDLAWKDVPVRWCMEDHLALGSMSLPEDEIHKLADAFRALPPFDIILVPMAIGGHLDHQLVRQAARQAFPAASQAFYEDLPYACRMLAPERTSYAFETGLSLSEVWLPVRGAPKGRKLEYALRYPSQIANDVAEEMEDYASEHGGRERFLMSAEARRMLSPVLQRETVL